MPKYATREEIVSHFNTFKSMDGENTKLFMGVELEVKVNVVKSNIFLDNYELQIVDKEALWVLDALKGHAILKPEGCAHFEIVTLPATLDYHRSILWNGFFDEGSKKFFGPEGCGLHIHFSRNAVEPAHLAKIISFYHRPETENFLSIIAGRKRGSRAIKKTYRPDDPAITLNETDTMARGAIAANTPLGGYMDAEETNISKTMEVRIFQSTVTRLHVMQSLEFVHAVIEWLRDAPAKEELFTGDSFVQWFVETNQVTNYPYLYTSMVQKNLLGVLEQGRSMLQRFFFKNRVEVAA